MSLGPPLSCRWSLKIGTALMVRREVVEGWGYDGGGG